MLLSFLLVLTVLGAGTALMWGIGVGKGPSSLGLCVALGLAALCVLSTVCSAIGLPSPVAGLLVLAGFACGVLILVKHRDEVRVTATTVWCNQRAATLLLAAAVAVPVVVAATAFAGVQAPLSTHDGAFHVEIIDGLRHGGRFGGWYPPGIEAGFAALLELTPWRDTAAGSFELALGLSILAPLLVFGLAASVTGDLTVGGLAALFAALTYLFDYFVHIWSGWPLETATLLLLGLWTLCNEYVRKPSARGAVASGVLVGSIVVTHGSELISAAVVVLILALASWRRLVWRRLRIDVPLAIGVAALCAAAYLPELLQWAAGGGSAAVGYAEAGALDAAAQTAAGGEPLRVFALDAFGIDLPVRIVLFVVGLWWVVRQRVGRSLVAVALVFALLGLSFSFFSSLGFVRSIYAVTYPWGLPYRLFLVDAVVIAMVAAAGGVQLARLVTQRRRLIPAARVLVGAWLVVATFAMVVFVSIPAADVSSFSADDAVAMAWLRANAPSDAVVVNDGYADAGIWTPYKAGLPIVMRRIDPDPALSTLVVSNVTRLDSMPDAFAAACRIRAKYVYYGAKNTGWQTRTFPPLEEMLAAPSLEEVFASGDATVFKLRLTCPPPG